MGGENYGKKRGRFKKNSDVARRDERTWEKQEFVFKTTTKQTFLVPYVLKVKSHFFTGISVN